jgi:predicted RNA-binding Zn-ribbon protein involved in translation (DUF1610 family)
MSRKNNLEYICEFSGCNKYLKEPITLPCGDMVCREHISDTATSFKCPDCEEEFIVPEEGFRINRKVHNFLKNNSHLTGKHKQVKVLFDQLEKELDDFQKSNSAHTQLYIHEYFAAIENKIDLHRDQMIDSIQKRSEQLLKKLKVIENECYENEMKIEKMNLKEEKKDEMNKLNEKLRDKNLQENDLIDMRNEINNALKEIRSKNKKFERCILMNKSLRFEEKDSKKHDPILKRL